MVKYVNLTIALHTNPIHLRGFLRTQPTKKICSFSVDVENTLWGFFFLAIRFTLDVFSRSKLVKIFFPKIV